MSFEELITKNKTKSTTKPMQLKIASELVDRVREASTKNGISVRDFTEAAFRDGLKKIAELTTGNSNTNTRRGRRPKEALAS